MCWLWEAKRSIDKGKWICACSASFSLPSFRSFFQVLGKSVRVGGSANFPLPWPSPDFLQKRLASEIRIPGFTQLNPTPKKLPFRNLRLSHVAFPRFPPEICPSSRDFFFSSFSSFSSPLLYLQLTFVALTCQLSFRAINSLFSTRSTLRLSSLLTRSSNFFPTCKFQQIHTMAGITPRYVGISQKFIIKRS